MRWFRMTAFVCVAWSTTTFVSAFDHGYNPYPGAVQTDKTHRHPQKPNRPNTDERAGHPQSISQHATLPIKYSPHYAGGWVGGGRFVLFPKKRDGRDITNEGTWGYDYVLFGRRPGRVFLDWWHDRKREPGMGTYDPDGVPVPDPLAGHFFQKLLTGGREHHAAEGRGH